MRTITIMTHAGVVSGLTSLFFGGLAWAYHSPYGPWMVGGGLGLLGLSAVCGWYYGFSPMWRAKGWEDQVAASPHPFVVSTRQFPPYIARRARGQAGARFGTAVYPLQGEEVAEEARAVYGLQWHQRQEAEDGHRWVVDLLRSGNVAELEPFRAAAEQP